MASTRPVHGSIETMAPEISAAGAGGTWPSTVAIPCNKRVAIERSRGREPAKLHVGVLRV